MPRKPRIPKYRIHKAKNLAVVTINGKHVYLGKPGSPESMEKYHQAIAGLAESRANPELAALPNTDPNSVSVNEIAEHYLAWAENRYRTPEGSLTSEFTCVKAALRPLLDMYGTSPAAEFGPKKLKLLRSHLATRGNTSDSNSSDSAGKSQASSQSKKLTRNTINNNISRIKRMFKWAASEELIAGTVYQDLRVVDGQQFRHEQVKESEGVRAVDKENVTALFPYITQPVADMLRLLLQTGRRLAARPESVATCHRHAMPKSIHTRCSWAAGHAAAYPTGSPSG